MATSGTFAFNLDIGEAVEEAFENIGMELRTGYDYKTARRSIDLLTIEWQNRGLNLWTVKFGTQALTAGTSSYTLDGKIFDIVEAFIRTDSGDVDNQFDQNLTRISISQYSHLSNKLSKSKPLQYYVERTPTGIVVNLWPSPDDQKTYTLGYYYMERIEDSGKPASNNMDIPSRYLPCLVSGLAYKLSLKYPPANDRSAILKTEYESQWELASSGGRDKASLFIAPGGYRF